MSKCGFNIDKDCIETKCHKCKLNPMYEQGRADGRAEAIKELRAELIESDLVTFSQVIDFLSDKLEQLKEHKNETE